MPPKYKKKSAFYYFLEYVKTAKRYKSLAYAQDEADKRWKLMTPEERLPYQEKAKRDANPNLNLENDMIRLEREEKEATLKNQNDMKHLINKLVQSNTLTSEYFHILHFNTFCYCDSNQKHYPAEVAMVRFNLNEGIEDGNMFSSIIQPGRIPIGYTLTVRQKSGETHQIPEPTIDSECNLKFIISKLYEIMAANQNSTTKEYPPIFVRDCDKTETNQILNQLCADYSIDRQAFRIYSLQYFFFVLRNAHREVWPSLSQSITEIEKDSYDCIPNLSCPYHKDTSAFIYCSECIVTRMVYIICDNCCAPWNITMKPGRHIPFNSLCVKPADVRRVGRGVSGEKNKSAKRRRA
ncbi:PREDICTED: protein maelstrom homolog isoform X2 [Nicrophorus vespilloides]|uniref:Protein maelstrom homolog isoform X2 n=1 Tax=Nicrophorus vespilloides TaxID=110193 RepID=A0ABM1M505_NICVS|nr:PREDICTED: protein maelstrom homolog isoform X2 [Nicrophorus vespilloides]